MILTPTTWKSLTLGFSAAVLGVLLMWTLQTGWYYYQVLRWVDAVRIGQAQQAQQQQSQKGPAPKPPEGTKP